MYIAVLTIAPARNGDKQTIAEVFDANGQCILGYVVAAGYGLLLEPFAGKGEVQLVPAVALLQLVGGVGVASQQEQQAEQAEWQTKGRHGVCAMQLMEVTNTHNYTEQKKY